ncbi:MAG: hypothetical protein ACFFD2_25710, partial [Promethearchaeota archaeon]
DLLTHLQRADLLVGFNIKRFDYGVLAAYTGMDFEDLNTFDILEYVHQRLGFRLVLITILQAVGAFVLVFALQSEYLCIEDVF